MELPQKTKNRVAILFSSPTRSNLSGENNKPKKITFTPVFTAALFTRAISIYKTWKQRKCPSTDEWIKMWYMYTMEYYSAIKKNEIIHLQQHEWT